MTSAFLGFVLGLLNPPNRRIRFRTYGGVGGAESRDSPLSRLTASWRGGYQRYIRALHLTIAPGLNCLSEEVPLFTIKEMALCQIQLSLRPLFSSLLLASGQRVSSSVDWTSKCSIISAMAPMTLTPSAA